MVFLSFQMSQHYLIQLLWTSDWRFDGAQRNFIQDNDWKVEQLLTLEPDVFLSFFIFTFFFFGEIRNLTTLCLLNNNGFSLSSFFLSLISFLWIGAQFPQEKFLSYGRILTLHYYFLLMCILFSFFFLLLFSRTQTSFPEWRNEKRNDKELMLHEEEKEQDSCDLLTITLEVVKTVVR